MKNIGSESEGNEHVSSDEEKPPNTKISLRNISKGQKKGTETEEEKAESDAADDDDDDDEDDNQPLADSKTTSGPNTRAKTNTTPAPAAVSFHFVSRNKKTKIINFDGVHYSQIHFIQWCYYYLLLLISYHY